MKFDELCKMVEEAKGSAKNTGGGKLERMKNSEGPAGFSKTSTVGGDNYQIPEPIDQKNRKGFDPKANTKQKNAKVEDTKGNKRKKTTKEKDSVMNAIGNRDRMLFNSFALLNNNESFKKRMETISTKFNKKLKSINEKDEKNLENYRVQIAKLSGQEEEQREILKHYKSTVDKALNNAIEMDVDDLDQYEDSMGADYDKEKLYKVRDKLANIREKLADVTNKNNILLDKIGRITQHNEKISEQSIKWFKDTVNVSAKEILIEKFDDDELEGGEVDWEAVAPEREDIQKMLVGLASKKREMNPIFSFIAGLDNEYNSTDGENISRGVMSHDLDRNSNRNENITIMRDFYRLPFNVISHYYNTTRISMMPIDAAIYEEKFKKAYKQFYNICTSKMSNPEKRWEGKFGLKLRQLLGIYDNDEKIESAGVSMNDAIDDHMKLRYEDILNDNYKERRGSNSFKNLLGVVDSDLRGKYPRRFHSVRQKLVSNLQDDKKEIKESKSFDEYANEYAQSSMNIDMNDFYIDLLEVKKLLDKRKAK